MISASLAPFGGIGRQHALATVEPRMKRGTVVLTCALLGALGSTVSAQVPDSSRGAAAGRAEITLVVRAAVSPLASRIAAAVFAPDSVPWIITVPDSSNAEWRRARDGLAAMLHARAVRPSDRFYSELTFGPIQVRADSLSALLTIASIQRCPIGPPETHPFSGKEMGTGDNLRVISSRVNGTWRAPVLKPVETWDGWCVLNIPTYSAARRRRVPGASFAAWQSAGSKETISSAEHLPGAEGVAPSTAVGRVVGSGVREPGSQG